MRWPHGERRGAAVLTGGVYDAKSPAHVPRVMPDEDKLSLESKAVHSYTDTATHSHTVHHTHHTLPYTTRKRKWVTHSDTHCYMESHTAKQGTVPEHHHCHNDSSHHNNSSYLSKILFLAHVFKHPNNLRRKAILFPFYR